MGAILDDISYKLTFEERDAYLYACVESDSVSFEMIIEYTNSIVQRLKSSRYDRLLLVNDSPVLPSTDCYLIASYVLKNGVPRKLKIAVVDTSSANARTQEQISHESRSAGLDIQSFTEVSGAEEWLRAENGRLTGTY